MEISLKAISAAAPVRVIDVHEGQYNVRFYNAHNEYYAMITAADYDEAKRIANDGATKVTDLTVGNDNTDQR